MQKTYRSNTAIALNLNLKDPRQRVHLGFMPLSDGGSVLVTDNRRLQKALEQHPRFGTLFRLETVVDNNTNDTQK